MRLKRIEVESEVCEHFRKEWIDVVKAETCARRVLKEIVLVGGTLD